MDIKRINQPVGMLFHPHSSDSAWAVDSAGKVWMRLGDISSALDRETGAVPVWIPVESASGSSTTVAFSRVSASCSGQMVWAVGAEEDGGQVYARLGIYADFRLGVEWVSHLLVMMKYFTSGEWS